MCGTEIFFGLLSTLMTKWQSFVNDEVRLVEKKATCISSHERTKPKILIHYSNFSVVHIAIHTQYRYKGVMYKERSNKLNEKTSLFGFEGYPL